MDIWAVWGLAAIALPVLGVAAPQVIRRVSVWELPTPVFFCVTLVVMNVLGWLFQPRSK